MHPHLTREVIEAMRPVERRALALHLAAGVLQDRRALPREIPTACQHEPLPAIKALGFAGFVSLMREGGGLARAVGDAFALIREFDEHARELLVYLGGKEYEIRGRADRMIEVLHRGDADFEAIGRTCAHLQEEVARGARRLREEVRWPWNQHLRDGLEEVAEFFEERGALLRGERHAHGGWLTEPYLELPEEFTSCAVALGEE